MANKQERKTVGEYYLDAVASNETYETEELRREMQKGYEKQIMECLDRGFKQYDSDFFIHVETKKERLTPNVIRNYFIPRKSCPFPFYDQVVYKYHRKDQNLEFIWVIPSKDTCIYYRNNVLSIDPEEKDLLNFVLDFYDGTLQKLCDRLNHDQNNEGRSYGRREIIA